MSTARKFHKQFIKDKLFSSLYCDINDNEKYFVVQEQYIYYLNLVYTTTSTRIRYTLYANTLLTA